MSKRILRVNVTTLNEHFGTSEDWMCVELTDHLRAVVMAGKKILENSGFDRISGWDYSPEWVICDTDTRDWQIRGDMLVVHSTGFLWDAYFKHTDIDLESDTIPFDVFDRDPEDLDLREYIYDPEEFGDEGDQIIRDPFEEVEDENVDG
jgi:hypothetical protein